MKKLAIITAIVLSVAAIAIIASADPCAYTYTVSNTAVKVASSRQIRSGAGFATNTAYAQGAIVTNNRTYYMAINAGTSGTNPPTQRRGTASDGTVTWLAIPTIAPNATGGAGRRTAHRNGIVVSVPASVGSDTVFVQPGYAMGASNGAPLTVRGGAWSSTGDDAYQGPVYAHGDSTNAHAVTVVEW